MCYIARETSARVTDAVCVCINAEYVKGNGSREGMGHRVISMQLSIICDKERKSLVEAMKLCTYIPRWV